jgi:hypothetical protein
MFSQTEIDQLKQKDCTQYLESVGYRPKSTHGKTVKYLAPWRNESSPSLHVYKNTNTFTDWGDRTKSGSVIQLCMAVEGVSFGKACEILSNGEIRNRPKLPPRQSDEPAIKLLYSTSIQSAWLCQYLAFRCIDLEVARKYCRQYRIELKRDDGTAYRKTAIGFSNDKGGVEFRSAKAKISNSPKYLTTINKGNKDLLLFEGFIDFLSFITLYGEPHDKTIIVLNSVSFISYVDFKLFDSCDFWCDSDSSGDRILEVVKAQVPTKDMRYLFAGSKDLNEFLMKKRERGLYKRELLQML